MNWPLAVSIVALLLVILGAVANHTLMTERRLAVLESELRNCLAK